MNKNLNFILQLSSINRILFCLLPAIAFMVLLLIKSYHWPYLFLLPWMAFSFFYIITSWYIFFNRPIEHIKKRALQDSGSRKTILWLATIASLFCLITIIIMLISPDIEKKTHLFTLTTVCSAMLAWTMVHTLFTYQYAHIYYNDDNADEEKEAGGLAFPGNEMPDYLDFAYFSFCMGCTFQVSDVSVTSQAIRRVILFHSLLAFALNSFVVAIIVNFMASK